MLQDCLPVKFQDVKFLVLKCKHEIFMRIDMKHSYVSLLPFKRVQILANLEKSLIIVHANKDHCSKKKNIIKVEYH